VLGGLLMQLGGGLLWDWLVRSWSRLPRREWLLVASIVTITAYFGFLYALVFGALAACVIFALDVSATDVIRGQFGLNERSSSLVRSVEETAILAAHGEAVIVLQLRSYLFFGSAYRVQEHLKALATSRLLQMVIFDFSAVTGIDSSAATSFARMRDLLLGAGIRIAVCGQAPAVARVISATGAPSAEIASYANLDEALEPAEAGFLCRQGGPTETLLFIERGIVSALVDQPQRDPMRIRVTGIPGLAPSLTRPRPQCAQHRGEVTHQFAGELEVSERCGEPVDQRTMRDRRCSMRDQHRVFAMLQREGKLMVLSPDRWQAPDR
jgi:anti-anti-sigma regulatory factor